MRTKAYATFGVCIGICTGAVLGFGGRRADLPLADAKIVAGGTINEDGTLSGVYGSGVRSSRSAPGHYEIRFENALPTRPVVYAIGKAGQESAIAPVTASSSGGFRLESPFNGHSGIPGEKINFAVGLRQPRSWRFRHSVAR